MIIRAIIAVLLVAAPVTAFADNDYSVLTLTYRGAAARLSNGTNDVSSLNHAPRIGFTVYGGDWFMKLRASIVSAPTGDGDVFAHDRAIGGGEVGVHLPGTDGNLAVGLLVEALTLGLNDRARDGPWQGGGHGLDGGVSVHYAFPAFGFLRFDPSVAAGASALFDDPRYSGVWAHAELELIAKLTPSLSIVIAGGLDVRRYGATNAELDARTIRFDVGVALHDFFGFGSNQP